MLKKISMLCLFASLFILLPACYSVKDVPRSSSGNGGSVVFTRPQQYTIWFGSRSLTEYIELTQESLTRNEAGQLVMDLGIRYKGADKWYNFLVTSPAQISFNARADFYTDAARNGAPVYSTNNQKILIRLGDTYRYRAVCPVNRAMGCQVIFSE